MVYTCDSGSADPVGVGLTVGENLAEGLTVLEGEGVALRTERVRLTSRVNGGRVSVSSVVCTVAISASSDVGAVKSRSFVSLYQRMCSWTNSGWTPRATLAG